ncbi:LYR motif-containing protein 2 isoform X1 [Rhineura floridana]|uniref:LYR motif-containing protein 2 isoform X1 n=1 Tax=Rhineura floridana TaxID=261503 RepID=UPI002AC8355C|nr:LYR motif-containing protein 2 isoform X1 [Rhineura floridana]
MAASRLPPTALTLKQFLRRQQVLQLYRKILQAVRQVPNEADRHYLRDWAREEFKRNKGATDQVLDPDLKGGSGTLMQEVSCKAGAGELFQSEGQLSHVQPSKGHMPLVGRARGKKGSEEWMLPLYNRLPSNNYTQVRGFYTPTAISSSRIQ